MAGFDEFSTVVWVLGNVIAFLVFAAAAAFSILYPILFKVELTTGGKLIWRAILSTAGFGLLVVIGLFVDGRSEWTEMPPNVIWWRPLSRLMVYGFIAFTFSSLVALLLRRRFWPKTVVTAPDEYTGPRRRSTD